MKRITLAYALPLLVVFATSSGGSTHSSRVAKSRPTPQRTPSVPVLVRAAEYQSSTAPELWRVFPLDTFTLAEFTFDTDGSPDPQGWMTHDATADNAFFHIDDFAGLPGYASLDGTKSLWCGARPDDQPYMCGWATLPGYGNSWSQIFESVPFGHEGEVTISYKVKWDCEPAFLDQTQLEYLNKDGVWTEVPVNGGRGVYDHFGELTESFVIDDTLITDTVRFRFFFASDGAWSDEDGLWPTDGAIIIDSLTVSDSTGVIDYQDFESEPLGALVTNDGDWQSRDWEVYGDYAGLFDGSNVLQEVPADTNTTGLWGFFNGSPYDYSCAGHPEQAVVPYGERVEPDWVFDTYISNEIWSPPVDLTRDYKGNPIQGTPLATYLEFDVYKDLAAEQGVCYRFQVRSTVDDCPQRWEVDPVCLVGEEKEWIHEVYAIDDLIDSLATEIQIKFEVLDLAYWYGSGDCHSHGPLFDNVKITRVFDVATGSKEMPSVGNLLLQNHPNPFNPTTTIRYSLANEGRVDLTIYDVTGRRVRTLVDASQPPRVEGYTVEWDGRNEAGEPVSSGVYFYRLSAPGFVETKKMVLVK
ncbi:MAG: T9SS type A sorting domain-containing protein [Candidatus Latescibacterota bacterium]|nr:MAG: T9SS type A sorting domain-containing protein [Candidatus Latescibacterota bacterium]